MSEIGAVSLAETWKFLAEKYGTQVTDLRPLGAGAWSQAFSFVLNGARHVIRWSDLSDNFERDAVAARFSRQDLPVPRISEIGRAEAKYYAISPFINGTFLEALSTAETERTLPALLSVMRALRAVDLSGTSGFGFWHKAQQGSHRSWQAFLLDDKNEADGSLIQGWRANLATSSMGFEAYTRLWERFARLVPACPEERGLVHADLINRNVLAEHGQITAVLDWGSSFYGDPLYEIAWFIFYEPWFPQFSQTHLPQRLLADFTADPATNKTALDLRLLCYKLDIGIGSIAYNAYKRDWEHAQEAANYTLTITSE